MKKSLVYKPIWDEGWELCEIEVVIGLLKYCIWLKEHGSGE